MLNLEDTSGLESDNSNEISVKFDDSLVFKHYNAAQKEFLKSLNKAHIYKPS